MAEKSVYVLFIAILFITLADDTLSIYLNSSACVAQSCGNGVKISYPFWIPDKQPSYCGLTAFKVTCNKLKPSYHISGEEFIIKEVFYTNHSILLAKADVIDEDNRCPVPRHNFSIRGTPFSLGPNTADLFFFYDCTQRYARETYALDCASNTSHYSFAVYRTDLLEHYNYSVELCQDPVNALVEVDSLERLLKMNYRQVLLGGFFLQWDETNCRDCQNSGGHCGAQSNEFMCICKDQTQPKTCLPGSKRIGLKVAIALIAVGAAFAVTCCLMCCLRIRKTKKTPTRKHNVEVLLRQYGSLAPTAYSYSDIKKMTNSFKEKLGEGGYGGVYKGNLNGHPVAVKILKETKGNGEEFINEVASISRTSHVNVVNLLGFCLNSREKALIYEFMPNGSLDKHIYNEDSNMEWEMLYKIALGIARGLEYLHRGCNSRILHFDIKPHNILLDEDFCPKISDFGLAKFCTRQESIMSTIEARGTIGYIAPEVFSRNFGGVSHKSDVYSYGMMVLEMVGGRKNYNAERSHNSEIYFPRWAYQRIFLDEDLNIRDMMTNEEEEIAKKMILVGLWCIQTDPLQRPAIDKVIEMLESSLETLQIPPKPFIGSPSQSEGSPLNTLEQPAKPFRFSTLSSTLESTASTIV
ncbi:LEAF RUST 10 DISEASE-RESISTANCE LOCUS RECEPTOR-LIKE PROTEIN KINASE-like 2.5 [Lycium barbarum]|uniref:LEAF RUST 10 DISEASE-RESISTANCE LOCUS RECEPTOR-LIKE PROTEIN KINASE-like 2.5 n=1 Tax=Lycium barbarum TaxID=112863 RepID=UPI00293EBF94|nr:LEAF RUST 10 DISEASE-RESISTANCE LOCUS RECEPTOR-LIKE PROTEIN KINASE-like 2.5 [Lycium barbarum]